MISLSTLAFITLAASASHIVPQSNALDIGQTVKRATDFSFDLFSGSKVQDDTSTKSPSELDYTTGGGVP